MPTTKKASKTIDTDEMNGLLAEYKTLRDEILSAKGRRLQTVSLTVGAFGAILSIIAGTVLGSNTQSVVTQLAVSIGGSVALYGILIPSQIMTRHLQQTIQRTGAYIRVFIEPRVPGLNWENRWNVHKSQHGLPKGLGGIGGIYYFLSLLPLLLPLYILSHSAQNWRFIFVLVPLLLWSLFLVMICKQPFQKDGSGNGKPTIKGPLPDKMRANKACTRLVGVGAFSGGLRGLELVPSKWRCLVPPTSG